MNRLTLGQIRQSTLPQAVGLCAADQPSIAAIVNEATQRLLFAGGETGWYGTWARMVFDVDGADNPYITLPRSVARLQALDVCRHPVAIQNEWYEFLEFGIGLQPSQCRQACQLLETYDRGVVITPTDLSPPNKIIRAYATSSLDYGKRVLLQGEDQNEVPIWSLDGINRVQGVYLSLASPFADTTEEFTEITGIQKDITYGPVRIYEVDADSGDQTLLLTMEPSETVAGYRRYFLNGLPRNCCNTTGDPASTTVQVTAMAKLEFIPVTVDTDYCLIGNLPALKEECQAVRYGDLDNPNGQVLAQQKHREAISLLNQELNHYLGRTKPAVNVAVFGSARLEYDGIGTLI